MLRLLLFSHCGPQRLRYGAVFCISGPCQRHSPRGEQRDRQSPPTPPLPTSQQELMCSGIVGHLHQFPLGREKKRGEGRGEGWVCCHCLLSIGWQALWHTYTYMIMKCHIFRSSSTQCLKGQEQNVVSVIWCRGEDDESGALGGIKPLLLPPLTAHPPADTQKETHKLKLNLHSKGTVMYNIA